MMRKHIFWKLDYEEKISGKIFNDAGDYVQFPVRDIDRQYTFVLAHQHKKRYTRTLYRRLIHRNHSDLRNGFGNPAHRQHMERIWTSGHSVPYPNRWFGHIFNQTTGR